MKCKEIIAKIEEKYPVSFAEGWDNSGFLAGDVSWEVKKVFLALDATDEVIDAAIQCGADMIITHHPLIFSGMKKVTADDFIGRYVIMLCIRILMCWEWQSSVQIICSFHTEKY